MNKITALALGLLFATLWSACNNEVDLIEEGHDIPVVYGFLDLADTAQYLRVMRVFGEENTSALQLAQDPDKLYYSDAEVSLRVGDQGERVLLEKVDGALEGYPRDTGGALISPNYLYKVRSGRLNLSGGEEITLQINRGGKTIGESTIHVLAPFAVRSPVEGDALTWHPRAPLTIKWRSSPYAKLYDIKMRIYISEHNLKTNDWTRKELVWIPVRGQIKRSGTRLYERAIISANDLYQFLTSNLEPIKDIERYWQGADITIYAGGQEFVDFQQVILANVGLTGSVELPLYSNIQNGLGVFSSKYHLETNNHTLAKSSIDSIQLNTDTRKLNFKN